MSERASQGVMTGESRAERGAARPGPANTWGAAALDALSAEAAVLDADGVILAVNRAWRDVAVRGGEARAEFDVGANYPTACRALAERVLGREEGGAVAEGVQRVLSGEARQFSGEYRCPSAAELRWYLVRAAPIVGAPPAAVLVTHEDVTDRKRVELRLRQSQEELETRVRERTEEQARTAELYRQLTEHLPDGVIYVASDGRILGANRAGLRSMNMPLEQLVRLTLADFAGQTFREDGSPMPVDDYPATRCLRTGEPQPPSILGLRAADGSTRWLLVTAVPWPCPRHSGRAGAVATFLDVTERKRAEDALRDSEERYRLLFERNPQPLWVYDAQSLRILAVNAAAVAQYGYARDEFLSMSVRDLYVPEDLPALDALVDTRADQLLDTTWRHRRRDGSVIEVQVASHPLTFAGRAAKLVLAQDVTARRRAEEALRQAHEELERRVRERTSELGRTNDMLRESESRFRQMAETIGEVVYTFDVALDRVLYVSPAYEAVFGQPCEALYRDFRAFYDAVHPDDLPRVKESMEARFQQTTDTVYRVKARPGESAERWVRSRAFPIRDAGGKIYRIAGIVEDITDIKRAAEELSRLQEEVLAATERERRRIGQDLHDGLGQQLTGVAFLSKSLQRRLATSAATAATGLADEAGQITDLVQAAIGQTRSLARGLHPVEQTPTGLMSALQELAAGTEATCRVACAFECDPPVCVANEATANHLFRIAQEAVNNAVKHAKASNILLSLSCGNDAATEVRVTDDGVGIAPGAGGGGLGLRSMRYRASVIGGQLTIGRDPSGRGTVVRCVVPPAAGRLSDGGTDDDNRGGVREFGVSPIYRGSRSEV